MSKRKQVQREIEENLNFLMDQKPFKIQKLPQVPRVKLIDAIQKYSPPVREGLFKLHTCALFCGAVGSGKTNAVVNLLKWYQEDKSFNRIIVVSPTFDNNRGAWEQLTLQRCDVYSEGVLEKGFTIVQEIERKVRKISADYFEYVELKEAFDAFNRGEATIRQAMLVRNEQYEYPKFQPVPSVAIVLDDLSHSKIYSISRDNPFVNLLLRHRHVFDIGVSFYLLTQNFNSGAPKILRQNIRQFHLYRTHDQTQLKNIYEQVAQGCTKEEFEKAFQIATTNKHDFLTVDLTAPDGETIFRRNFDELITIPSSTEEELSSVTK